MLVTSDLPVLCYHAPETRQDKRYAMISPCQVADYWSLQLPSFYWLELYGSSAGFDGVPKSSIPTLPFPTGCRWTIQLISPTNRIFCLASFHPLTPVIQLTKLQTMHTVYVAYVIY